MKDSVITIPLNIEVIGFFSDLHGKDGNLSEMLKANQEIQFWFSCGDNIELYGKLWNNCPTIRKLRKNNIKSILGNHEVDFLKNDNLRKNYYSEPEYIKFISDLHCCPK
jgi:hypothetical protein